MSVRGYIYSENSASDSPPYVLLADIPDGVDADISNKFGGLHNLNKRIIIATYSSGKEKEAVQLIDGGISFIAEFAKYCKFDLGEILSGDCEILSADGAIEYSQSFDKFFGLYSLRQVPHVFDEKQAAALTDILNGKPVKTSACDLAAGKNQQQSVISLNPDVIGLASSGSLKKGKYVPPMRTAHVDKKNRHRSSAFFSEAGAKFG